MAIKRVEMAGLEGVTRQYGIRHAEITLVSNTENEIYRVNGEEPPELGGSQFGQREFSLRVHTSRRHTTGEIQSELDWLRALTEDAELNVPEPVRTVSGCPIASLVKDGTLYDCVLFRWVHGRAIRHPPMPKTLKAMGSYIAQVHAHSRIFQPLSNFVRPQLDREGAFSPTSIFVGGERPKLSDVDFEICMDAWRATKIAVDALPRDSSRFGLIHGDSQPRNFLHVKGRLALLDFNECAFGDYLYDLAAVWWYLERECPNSYEQLWKALLDGYTAVSPLRDFNVFQLEVFVAMRTLHMIDWIAKSSHPSIVAWSSTFFPTAARRLKRFLQGN